MTKMEVNLFFRLAIRGDKIRDKDDTKNWLSGDYWMANLVENDQNMYIVDRGVCW